MSMWNRLGRWGCVLLIASASGLLFSNSCLMNAQNNLDLLYAPEANLNFVHQSWLVKNFGPGILKFW